MGKKRRVVLYGKSLLLGTVGASLQGYSDLALLPLALPLPAPREIAALAPDVVILDVAATPPETALGLLQACPCLRVIGIDPNSDQMLLWSGEHTRVLSMQDLVQAIHALPEVGAARVHAVPASPPWSWLAARLNGLRMPSRRRALAYVVVAVCFSGMAIAVLALTRPNQGTLLSGTAMSGTLAPQLVLAFAAGIVLGAVLIGWWFWRGKRG